VGSKVVLIRPPIVVFPRSLSSYGPVPHIGLAYIAAVLRQSGHEVEVIDGSGEGIDRAEDFDTPVGRLRRIGLSPKEIVDRVPLDADLVGISHMFLHEWPHVREIAELLRARSPEVPVILGGENATAFHRWIFAETDAVDACVLGEGEAVVVELASRIAEGRTLHGMTGVAFRSADGQDIDTGLSPRLRELGDIPRPAWDLFPLHSYWKYSDFFGIHRGRSIPMLATRGCPYRCTFCSSPQMWTTRYVVRDPEDVVDEIEEYVSRYGVESINFCDLTAVTKRGWTLDFCDALERRGLDVEWQVPVGTRVEALDAEVLQRLWDTGCRYITFAPESGSLRMLEIYDKRVSLEKIHDALRASHRIGIRSRVNIIIGHPDERWSDQWHSFRFLLRAAVSGCDDAAVIMFCPYPGSKDFERLVEQGEHHIDEAAFYVGLSRAAAGHVSHNPRMSSGQLRIVQLVMAAAFYGVGLLTHPGRAKEYLVAQRSGRENTFLDQLVRIKRRGFRPADPDEERSVEVGLRSRV
jgi:anaerobic magnesium-protoporphyrin IX monomethyl ester cyclase